MILFIYLFIELISRSPTPQQRGKCRDISVIYHVSGGVDTILCGEKSRMRNFTKKLSKYRQFVGDISAKSQPRRRKIVDISAINRRFFGDMSTHISNMI